jgi:hypothetical protein
MKFPVRMVGKHGAMHAYSTSEVAQLQSLGWSVERPTEEVLKEALAESMRLDPPLSDLLHRGSVPEAEPIPNAPLDAPVAPLVLPVVSEPPKRKPGRPPKAK